MLKPGGLSGCFGVEAQSSALSVNPSVHSLSPVQAHPREQELEGEEEEISLIVE